MIRLVLFATAILVSVMLLTTTRYSDRPLSNQAFNLKMAEKQYYDNIKKREQMLLAMKQAKLAQSKKKQKVKRPSLISLDTEELKRGFTAYEKRGKCVTCHGKNGEGKKSQKAPKIAGQHSWYLYKQLVDMKEQRRPNPKMYIYLKKLTLQELKDISHYLSKLPVQ